MEKPKRKPKHVPFYNEAGKSIRVPAEATVGDLLKMGFTDIGIVKPDAPFAPGEWRSK